MVHLIEITKYIYEVRVTGNDKFIGTLIYDISGEWYYDPLEMSGWYSSDALSAIAAKIEGLSKKGSK